MYYINFLFDMETNFLIGGILLGVTVLVCCGLAVLSFLMKKPLLDLIGAIAAGVLIVANTLFCFNVLVMIAFLLSVAAFAFFLTRVCQEYHKKTIYEIPFWRLYFRMLCPTFAATMLFRPWFALVDESYYRIMAGLGLNFTGVYVYDVTVVNEAGTGTVWNIISVVEVLLFLLVFVMQVILIWREFVDPDNAATWATFGMIVTAIGGMFIYGVYTSPNFMIATFMEAGEKLNFDTMEFETVFSPVFTEEHTITFAPVMMILVGLVNRVFYFEKRRKAKD